MEVVSLDQDLEPQTDEGHRLHDLAVLTIQLCLTNCLTIALFAGATILFYPGVLDTPRPNDAVSVIQVAGSIGILAIVGFVIVGVVNARHGVVLPWLQRGGRMP